ncbi:hypothetical protein NQ314_004887 [Rhamnusium bicolor]|uniref:Uncharacterized protein n=1 Tax=Rhamnusium bicolor TaxID=1586634 RepID=A0AAV8ZIL0_9CUCU|nr:hypothetical protein NQ314_004887 [Rhamnusium bicolor]
MFIIINSVTGLQNLPLPRWVFVSNNYHTKYIYFFSQRLKLEALKVLNESFKVFSDYVVTLVTIFRLRRLRCNT